MTATLLDSIYFSSFNPLLFYLSFFRGLLDVEGVNRKGRVSLSWPFFFFENLLSRMCQYVHLRILSFFSFPDLRSQIINFFRASIIYHRISPRLLPLLPFPSFLAFFFVFSSWTSHDPFLSCFVNPPCMHSSLLPPTPHHLPSPSFSFFFLSVNSAWTLCISHPPPSPSLSVLSIPLSV